MAQHTNQNSTHPGRRICVLGGGGFLGSHLVARLLRTSPYQIEVVDTHFDRLSMTSPRLVKTQSSVTEQGVIDRVTQESDVVFSLTALCNPSLYNTQPLQVIEENYTHLVPLVELCSSRQRRLIHFSTCEVYGKNPPSHNPQQTMSEQTSPLLLGPVHKERWTYSCAKQLLERLIWAHGTHRQLPFTIVRPFNVIGPQMDYLPGIDGEGVPRVLACFIKALLSSEPLQLVNGGVNRRSFIYIDDFVDAIVQILERPRRCQGEIINIGNPANDVSIKELAQHMVEHYRSRYPDHPHPSMASVSERQFYGPGYDDVEQRIPDITKAQQLLDWEPTTSLRAMLPPILEDYINRYGLSDSR